MTYVLGIGLQKGGVAKTTNTLHLAAALARVGRRVLVWDVDTNRGATRRLQIPDSFAGSYELLTDPDCDLSMVTIGHDDEMGAHLPDGVSLIPSSRRMEQLELTLQQSGTFANPMACMVAPCDQLRDAGEYDLVLIDTAPSLQLATKATYLAADGFVLSMVPRRDAFATLEDAIADLKLASRPGLNPKLRLLGIILSQYDSRHVLSRHYEGEMADHMGGLHFSTPVNASMAVPRAESDGVTIVQRDPGHPVSKQYATIAVELLARIEEGAR